MEIEKAIEQLNTMQQVPQSMDFVVKDDFVKNLPQILSNVKELGEWAKRQTESDRNLILTTHDDFENAKKEIKKFSEQTTTDLDLRRVDDSKGVGEFLGDWFFGRGIGKDHLVKGEELNDLTSQIQTHLHSINNT